MEYLQSKRIDWVAILTVGVAFPLAYIDNYAEPYRPVTPDVNDARYNYKFDGETISTTVLYTTLFCAIPVGVFMIWLIERDHFRWTTYKFVRGYLASLIGVFFFTALTKRIAAEPRPCFFDEFCNWNDILNRCDFADEHDRRRAFGSFPSGHASSSTCLSVFFFMFFKDRVQPFTRVLIMCACATIAYMYSITRILDNMHAPTDVFAGCIIGCVAWYLAWKGIINPKKEDEYMTDLENARSSIEQEERSRSSAEPEVQVQMVEGHAVLQV